MPFYYFCTAKMVSTQALQKAVLQSAASMCCCFKTTELERLQNFRNIDMLHCSLLRFLK